MIIIGDDLPAPAHHLQRPRRRQHHRAGQPRLQRGGARHRHRPVIHILCKLEILIFIKLVDWKSKMIYEDDFHLHLHKQTLNS